MRSEWMRPSVPQCALLWLCCCALPEARALGWRSDEAFVLQLDDQQYALPPGGLAFSASGHITLQAPLALSQCQRRNAAALLVSPYRLIYDSVGRALYLQSPVLQLEGATLRLTSSSGDLVCAGATPAVTLFTHSFE